MCIHNQAIKVHSDNCLITYNVRHYNFVHIDSLGVGSAQHLQGFTGLDFRTDLGPQCTPICLNGLRVNHSILVVNAPGN